MLFKSPGISNYAVIDNDANRSEKIPVKVKNFV
jgi:hypothetical protein